MTSLLSRMKTDSLTARKSAIGKSTSSREWVKSQLLITLISEASKIGKDASNRDSTDDEVSSVLKKFLKGMDETLKLEAISPENRTKVSMEKSIIEEYLPSQLDETALRAEIELIAAERGTTLTLRDTSVVMKTLNEKYPGQVSGAVVSKILKVAN